MVLVMLFSLQIVSGETILQQGVNNYQGTSNATIISNDHYAINSLTGTLTESPYIVHIPFNMGLSNDMDCQYVWSGSCPWDATNTICYFTYVNTGFLVRFNLDTLQSTPVENAFLELYVSNVSSKSKNGTKLVSPITVTWTESDVTADTLFSASEYSSGRNGVDFSQRVECEGKEAGQWEQFDVTDMVNNMISGKSENFGFYVYPKLGKDSLDYYFALLGSDHRMPEINSGCKYASNINPDTTLRPKLVLNSSATALGKTERAVHTDPIVCRVADAGTLVIQSPKDRKIELQIFAPNGRLIHTVPSVAIAGGSAQVSVNHLSQGCYIAQIRGEGIVHSSLLQIR